MQKRPSKESQPAEKRKLRLKKQTIKDLPAGKAKDIKGGGYNTQYCGGMIEGSRCDRAAKEAFADVDNRDVLEGLLKLPVQTWNYRDDDRRIRHIGPMAQDFAALFRVGADDKHIQMVDVAGVAFSAIQALTATVKQSEAEIRALRVEVRTLNQRIARRRH